jgi:hypothetical protein
MKVVSMTPEELEDYEQKTQALINDNKKQFTFKEKIIKQINQLQSKRPKFKDERKIMIGISKKDITNVRKKQKGAFMNCFAIIIRFQYDGIFREIHVKVFNTGKLEIPGILNSQFLEIVKEMVITTIQPYCSECLSFTEIPDEKNRSVIINSNFRCGFFVDQNMLYSVLKNKYNIDVSFDPCSYPGVKCVFHCSRDENGNIQMNDKMNDNEQTTKVTFSVFRTGSCLISGNCSEEILYYVYDFGKRLLQTEYNEICMIRTTPALKNKLAKKRRKIIEMTPEYFFNL